MKGSRPASVSPVVMLPFARLLEAAPQSIRQAILAKTGRMLSASRLSWHGILDRTSARIPQRTSVQMLEAAIEITGDAALGLHGAEASRPGDFELLEYLVRTSATVGESWEVWRRYLPIVLDADFEVTREGKWSVGRLRFAPDLLVTPALVDYSLAFALLLTLRNAPSANPKLAELQLKQERPAYAAEYQRILGRMPRFGQPHDGIVFNKAFERAPMQSPDPVLQLVLSRQAQLELSLIKRHRSVAGRTREAIAQTISRGAPLPEVARALGASPATLRRWLAAQDTSYRVLVEQARRDIALQQLETHDLSIAEIAASLGYNHPSAFDRAFKRWYGRTPSEYRDTFAHGAVAMLDER